MGGVCGIGSIKGRLSPIGSLQGALSIPVGGGLDCDIYEGEYNIVPSDTVQVLPTANKLLKHDIVIEANSGGLPEGSEMANDITRLDGILAGIGGTNEEATVVAYVTKMINALGIGDYVKTTTMTTELGKKVDKVEGSRLMTNAEGTKLAGIAAGAQANVIEKIKVNGTEVTPAAEDKSIALTIPTGKLAGKDIVAEADLDTALKEKVNAAAEGNHSHANKAFLDTLSGATDEEVTAMCTEVFGA